MTALSGEASPVAPVTDLEVATPPAVVIDNDTGAIDAKAAESSPAIVPDAKAPPSLLDVVKSAVAPAEEPVAPSAPEGEKVEPTAEELAALAEPKVEDDTQLPFHNHPRFKAILEERNALREPAENYGKITEFMQVHGLLPEEVTEGYEIMASLKSGDPVKLAEVREWFAVRLQALDEGLGNVLPADLQQRVEEGLLDEAGAAEISRSRAAAALTTARITERDASAAEATRAQEATTTANAMATAVEGWETATRLSDPDYPKKADLIETTCRAIVQRTGNPPKSAAEAVALVKQAHGEVTERLLGLMPKPKSIVPGPSGATVTALAAPKTLKEAIERAAGG